MSRMGYWNKLNWTNLNCLKSATVSIIVWILKIVIDLNPGCQGGLAVINRASHLCDPSSTLASGRMWAEFQSISI